MARRIHVVVTGRVQNVGFRAFVQLRASELGLSGWVRNLSHGRQLEFEAEGDERAVDQLLIAVRRGPPSAHVESVMVNDKLAESQAPKGFHVQ
ncbi:MAG: acylphosphatase [Chloroflexi bacterium]|nr:acylphosphatase [Chloroflexota bacterium]